MNTSAQIPIVVIGSVNTDMVVKTSTLPSRGETVIGGQFFMSAGGKGGNQAVAAARLGGNVSMIANLGTDVFGDSSINKLKSEGINCGAISRDKNQASGIALITVDEKGENHIAVAPGSNSTLTPHQIECALTNIPNGSLILLQLEIPLISVDKAIEIARQKNCKVILDPAPAQELSTSLYSGIFLLTPNETEAEILSGQSIQNEHSARAAAKLLLERGIENVAITLGSQGVLFANKQNDQLIQATEVSAVDSTAAGDCFNGSLAVALSRGNSLQQSIAFGCKAAAVSVTRLGAQDSMPHKYELEM